MTMPVGFVAHGAPTLALDHVKGAPLRAWAQAMPTPQAIVVVSAHWETSPLSTGAVETKPLIYDFSGFPPPLYQVQYPAPGAPALSQKVRVCIEQEFGHAAESPQRGFDHGVWVPLLHMYPQANIPVLQVSLPRRASAQEVFRLGYALASLREEGVLLLGSGVITHNLARLDFSDPPVTPVWAQDFDAWCAERLQAWDIDALVNFRQQTPNAQVAHPTDEHFAPLLFALGAASVAPSSVAFPVVGFEFGSLSRRCVQFD